MPTYAIHDAAGSILQTMEVDADDIARQVEVLFPGATYLQVDGVEPHDSIDVSTGEVVKGEAPTAPANPPRPELPEYAAQRQQLYPPIEVQLDMLWHAMDAGEIPKATAFYDRIKLVKDSVTKEGTPEPTIIYTVEEVPAQ